MLRWKFWPQPQCVFGYLGLCAFFFSRSVSTVGSGFEHCIVHQPRLHCSSIDQTQTLPCANRFASKQKSRLVTRNEWTHTFRTASSCDTFHALLCVCVCVLCTVERMCIVFFPTVSRIRLCWYFWMRRTNKIFAIFGIRRLEGRKTMRENNQKMEIYVRALGALVNKILAYAQFIFRFYSWYAHRTI